jgi:hypothetical protein
MEYLEITNQEGFMSFNNLTKCPFCGEALLFTQLPEAIKGIKMGYCPHCCGTPLFCRDCNLASLVETKVGTCCPNCKNDAHPTLEIPYSD